MTREFIISALILLVGFALPLLIVKWWEHREAAELERRKRIDLIVRRGGVLYLVEHKTYPPDEAA